MRETVRFAIAVPTYRRPAALAGLLRNLDAEVVVPDGFELSEVLVVDNDREPSARSTVDAMRGRLPFRHVHEPLPGIAAARNRALVEAGDVTYVAMVDDDEEVVADWPAGLLRVAERTGADLVAGPVDPRPAVPVPPWMLRPHVLGRAQHDDVVAVTKVPSTNLLVRRDLRTRMDPVFDPAFGLSGGSDTLLCARLVAAGGRIHWSATARTAELYPAERLTMAWLRRRWHRNGANMVAIDLALAGTPSDRARIRLRRGAEGAVRVTAAPVLYLAAVRGEDREYRRARAQRQLFQGVGLLGGVLGRRVVAYGPMGSEAP